MREHQGAKGPGRQKRLPKKDWIGNDRDRRDSKNGIIASNPRDARIPKRELEMIANLGIHREYKKRSGTDCTVDRPIWSIDGKSIGASAHAWPSNLQLPKKASTGREE